MKVLEKLTVENFAERKFPARQLLKNSLFYPACEFDGRFIKYCNRQSPTLNVVSYVHCDNGVTESDLLGNITTIKGYTVIGTKRIVKEDLKVPYALRSLNTTQLGLEWSPNFIRWFVLERNNDSGERHGPKKLSLLYVCAEGVESYKILYCANLIVPKIVAITEHGWGNNQFGSSCSDFGKVTGKLYQAITTHGKGVPKIIFYNQEELQWAQYELRSRWYSFTSWIRKPNFIE